MNKKKLYYTVTKELVSIGDNDGIEETTGNKTITTYSVVNGEIERQFEVEGSNDDNSMELIQMYLDDNGMGDDEFLMVLL